MGVNFQREDHFIDCLFSNSIIAVNFQSVDQLLNSYSIANFVYVIIHSNVHIIIVVIEVLVIILS